MSRKIQITVFAVNRDNAQKKKFVSYFGDLVKKDGTVVRVGVKFRQPCEGPAKDECPCNIVFDTDNANLASRYDAEKDKVYQTLWISEYEMGEPYEDHSLDDF